MSVCGLLKENKPLKLAKVRNQNNPLWFELLLETTSRKQTVRVDILGGC